MSLLVHVAFHKDNREQQVVWLYDLCSQSTFQRQHNTQEHKDTHTNLPVYTCASPLTRRVKQAALILEETLEMENNL